MKLVIDPLADQEINTIIDYLNGEVANLGWRFFDQFGELLMSIEKNSRRCPWVDDTYRKCRVGVYRYSVVYRVGAHEIKIVAVYHQSRDPHYWRVRED